MDNKKSPSTWEETVAVYMVILVIVFRYIVKGHR
jgi:hypothetical protein